MDGLGHLLLTWVTTLQQLRRDIVEMTNRLAAGGKLAGLTAPDILGLATAMSSVGIEAEADWSSRYRDSNV